MPASASPPRRVTFVDGYHSPSDIMAYIYPYGSDIADAPRALNVEGVGTLYAQRLGHYTDRNDLHRVYDDAPRPQLDLVPRPAPAPEPPAPEIVHQAPRPRSLVAALLGVVVGTAALTAALSVPALAPVAALLIGLGGLGLLIDGAMVILRRIA